MVRLGQRDTVGAFRASTFRAIEVEAADHAFDLQAGTDTAGIVRLESLSINSPNRTLGVHYQASEPDSFRRTIAALPLRHEDFVFVDFGSGKGRALLLASEFPFKRIMGVEFSDELSAIARENVASFPTEAQRCGDIEIVCEDAAEFELPVTRWSSTSTTRFTSPSCERSCGASSSRSTTTRGRHS